MSPFRRGTMCAFVILTLTLASNPAARAAEVQKVPGKLSLGLLQVTAGEGFSDRQISTIEEVLLTSFEATGRFKVIGRTDINALLGLETKKEALGCNADTACVAQLAGALGVDLVATADVGLLGSKTIIALTVISVRTATVLKRLRRTVTNNDDLIGAMDSMVAEVSAATGGPAGGTAPLPQRTYVAPTPAPYVPYAPPAPYVGPPAYRAYQPPPAYQAYQPPPPPPPQLSGPQAVLSTSEGKPRTLHLQLGAKFDTAYTIAVANDLRSLTCPFPLSRTQGCDLGPIEAGDAKVTLLSGTDKVKDLNLTIPQDGAMLKLVLVRPGWARGIGITACVLGGLSALVAVVAFGIDSDTIQATVPGVVSALIAAGLFAVGIPMLVAIHTPDFVPLESSDVIISAPQ